MLYREQYIFSNEKKEKSKKHTYNTSNIEFLCLSKKITKRYNETRRNL